MGVELEAEVISIGTVNRIACTFTQKEYDYTKKHFGKDSLIIEEDFILKEEDSKALGLRGQFKIGKGVYPITYDAIKKLYSVNL